eukprot:764529-Hanusia_phi.AAC.2
MVARLHQRVRSSRRDPRHFPAGDGRRRHVQEGLADSDGDRDRVGGLIPLLVDSSAGQDLTALHAQRHVHRPAQLAKLVGAEAENFARAVGVGDLDKVVPATDRHEVHEEGIIQRDEGRLRVCLGCAPANLMPQLAELVGAEGVELTVACHDDRVSLSCLEVYDPQPSLGLVELRDQQGEEVGKRGA